MYGNITHNFLNILGDIASLSSRLRPSSDDCP